MKLFYKVYLFLILVLILILAAAGLISYHREVSLFNDDMEKDAILIGQVMSGMIEHTIQKSGRDMALKLILDANSKEHSIHIRWVDLGPAAIGMYAPTVSLKKIERVFQGETASLTMEKNGGGLYRFTYIPILTDTDSHFAIELSESLSPLKKYIRNSVLHLIIMAVLLFLTSGALLWFQFQKWIHQPLVRFIDKSRRIGQGDLTPDLVVIGRDEFAELGETLNSMCKELHDSWEELRLENERRIEAIEQLRHAERLATLGRLSAGMAHEFGTPLNVIYGRSKLIRSGKLERVDVIESARIIGEQAEKIIKIMQNLLDFARRRKPNRSLQNMAVVVQRVIEMLSPEASKAKVALQIIKKEDIPLISVDPLQIQQVLTNLLINGIQAMTGGGRLEVELEILNKQHPEKKDRNRDYLAIHIEDEGRGILPENIAHIFEPFFTTKEVGSGTGLGLSIAYGIIQEHDGWIEVDSTPNKGTCFKIYLPVEVSQ
jgi:two-component system, NtrC family, sensor kinase